MALRQRYAVLLTLCLLGSGCQSASRQFDHSDLETTTVQRIEEDEALTVIDPEIKVAFATGKLELVQPGWMVGYGAAAKAGATHAELRQLYAERLWPLVVNLIAKQNFGDDLHYYLLGISAEELGYLPAAAIYYQTSIEESKRPMTGKCLKCMSMKFPERAIQALDRVEHRMRATNGEKL